MMNVSIKLLGVNLVTLFLITPNGTKQMTVQQKKIHIWNRVRLSQLWHIGQICTIPKYTKKEHMISSETGKKYDLLDV